MGKRKCLVKVTDSCEGEAPLRVTLYDQQRGKVRHPLCRRPYFYFYTSTTPLKLTAALKDIIIAFFFQMKTLKLVVI